MMTLIVSDNQVMATHLRNGLLARGHDCPTSHLISMDVAADAVQQLRTEPELILVVLSPIVERSEAAIRALRTFRRARLVAVGPRDPNRILGAFHEGIDDYLDERSNVVEDLVESLNRAAAHAQQVASTGHVISVVAGSGGSGRTTIAANLSVLIARQFGRCGLLDLDLRGGNAATLLDLKPKHTIAEVCRSIEKVDQKMFEQSLVAHESGVHLLPAPAAMEDDADVTTEKLTRVVQLARALFPWVVADINDCCREGHGKVLRQSALVLVVSRLEFSAIENTRKLLDYLERYGVERNRIRFLVNRAGQPHELPASRVEEALGLGHFDTVPDDPKSVNLSINCGRPCVIETPRSRFALAMERIATRIVKEANPAHCTADSIDATVASNGSAVKHRFPPFQWLWSRLSVSAE